MVDNHEGCERGFHDSSAAWYAAAFPDREVEEIMIGFYAPDGSTSGEFAIRWHLLQGAMVPRLEVFDDAWGVLAQCADLVAALAEIGDTTPEPEKIAALLLRLGFRDLTEYEDPRARAKAVPA